LNQIPVDYQTRLVFDRGEQYRDTVAPFDLTLKDTEQIPQRPRTDNHIVSRFHFVIRLNKTMLVAATANDIYDVPDQPEQDSRRNKLRCELRA
jgi:hypothetical protein